MVRRVREGWDGNESGLRLTLLAHRICTDVIVWAKDHERMPSVAEAGVVGAPADRKSDRLTKSLELQLISSACDSS